MDFRQIEAFVHVIKLKSFSKAADAIFLTQPTISTHINSLEKELGTKLVDRSGKEILPTKAGKIFYDYANSLLNVRDNAVHALKEFSTKIEGKLEIAASTVPAQYLLPELMAAFLELYRGANFSITQLDSNDVIDAVLENRYELGIVGTSIENSKLSYNKLFDDKLVVITPNNGKFTGIASDTIPFSLIEKENFIFRESGSGTRHEFEKILKDNGIDSKAIKIIAKLNSTEAIKQSVSLGLGISIVSLVSVTDYLRFGLIKAFNIEGILMQRAFYSVIHKTRPISPLHSAFLSFAADYYKKKR